MSNPMRRIGNYLGLMDDPQFDTPEASTKFLIPRAVYPLLLRPDIVGSLGSSQSFTMLFSISSKSFLLLVTV